MAYQKTFIQNWFESNYWMIGNIASNKIDNITIASMRLYKDKAQRDSDIHSYVLSTEIIINWYITDVQEIYTTIANTHTSYDEQVIDEENSTEWDIIYKLIPYFQDAIVV